MPVIAMTREMGTRGKDVALGLAEELGLGLVQHELVEHVAEKMHRPASAVNRLLEGTASALDRWRIKSDDLSLYTAEEIIDIAAEGNVLIRGWGATYVLRPVSHVLCMRVCAPLAFRAKVMTERTGIKDQDALVREIERNDEAHTRTIFRHVGLWRWQDPVLYDLVLNTSHVSVSECITLVKGLVGRPEFQETPESQSRLAALKLETHIRTALRSHSKVTHAFRYLDLDLEPSTGAVTLQGVVTASRFSREAEQIVLGVGGVHRVENRLVVSPDYWT